jgi:cyclophilin family peptidyl-prolyl cis-trans isomerase
MSEPSYMGTSLSRVVDGKYVDLGHIPRVNVFSLAGSQELEFNGRIIPDSEFALEENDFVHDRRGLLSRARFSVVPDFCITLMPCPQLDFSHVVFGDLIGGTDVLKQIEKVPLYTYRSTEQEVRILRLEFDIRHGSIICRAASQTCGSRNSVNSSFK